MGYFIETWDSDLQEFTPQEGVPSGPYTLFGLRLPMRELQSMGYPCDRGDNAVLIWNGEAYRRDNGQRSEA